MLSHLETIFNNTPIQSFVLLSLLSFILSTLIMVLPNYGFNRRRQADASAIQSAHTGFVPRVGGLAIYCCIIAMLPISYFYNFDLGYLIWLIISTLPIFIIGLAEDLGYQMSPKYVL